MDKNNKFSIDCDIKNKNFDDGYIKDLNYKNFLSYLPLPKQGIIFILNFNKENLKINHKLITKEHGFVKKLPG